MTIAQLSACRYVFQEPRLSAEREKIRLNMGVLKMLGDFWPAGKREYKAVGIIARKILDLNEDDARVPLDVVEAVPAPFDMAAFGFGDADFLGCGGFGSADMQSFGDGALYS